MSKRLKREIGLEKSYVSGLRTGILLCIPVLSKNLLHGGFSKIVANEELIGNRRTPAKLRKPQHPLKMAAEANC